ncbi:MAG: hypothetical protein A2496_23840 [Burkholderiales bacterium RIFOXYC12_FULL_60_6]|nr:MAG: hypothetical protein A2496_23840 [Burkholderiales bacterium RIFOXYC12_FULL_60_6]
MIEKKAQKALIRDVSYRGERWFKLLEQAVGESGKSNVAKRLSNGFEKSYGRSAISQIMHGIYRGKPTLIAERVMLVLDRRSCPYLGTQVEAAYCHETNTGPTPTWDPSALAQRRMCQKCEHKPEGDKS